MPKEPDEKEEDKELIWQLYSMPFLPIEHTKAVTLNPVELYEKKKSESNSTYNFRLSFAEMRWSASVDTLVFGVKSTKESISSGEMSENCDFDGNASDQDPSSASE